MHDLKWPKSHQQLSSSDRLLLSKIVDLDPCIEKSGLLQRVEGTPEKWICSVSARVFLWAPKVCVTFWGFWVSPRNQLLPRSSDRNLSENPRKFAHSQNPYFDIVFRGVEGFSFEHKLANYWRGVSQAAMQDVIGRKRCPLQRYNSAEKCRFLTNPTPRTFQKCGFGR